MCPDMCIADAQCTVSKPRSSIIYVTRRRPEYSHLKKETLVLKFRTQIGFRDRQMARYFIRLYISFGFNKPSDLYMTLCLKNSLCTHQAIIQHAHNINSCLRSIQRPVCQLSKMYNCIYLRCWYRRVWWRIYIIILSVYLRPYGSLIQSNIESAVDSINTGFQKTWNRHERGLGPPMGWVRNFQVYGRGWVG